MSEGYNIFRVPFAMERMAPGSVSGSLSQAYLTNYSAVINHITGKGGWAIVDPHNFGRYNGAIITDTSAFQTFWQNVAGAFKSNANAVSGVQASILIIIDQVNVYRSLIQITNITIWTKLLF